MKITHYNPDIEETWNRKTEDEKKQISLNHKKEDAVDRIAASVRAISSYSALDGNFRKLLPTLLNFATK